MGRATAEEGAGVPAGSSQCVCGGGGGTGKPWWWERPRPWIVSAPMNRARVDDSCSRQEPVEVRQEDEHGGDPPHHNISGKRGARGLCARTDHRHVELAGARLEFAPLVHPDAGVRLALLHGEPCDDRHDDGARRHVARPGRCRWDCFPVISSPGYTGSVDSI
eukprot:gene13951-biopygen1885